MQRLVEATGVDGAVAAAVDRFGIRGGIERQIWLRIVAYLAPGKAYGGLRGPFVRDRIVGLDQTGWARLYAPASHSKKSPFSHPNGMPATGRGHWCFRCPHVPDRIVSIHRVQSGLGVAPIAAQSIQDSVHDPDSKPIPRCWHRRLCGP